MNEEPDRRQAPQKTSQAYEAKELFKGEREVAIRFHGEIYRLRITRNDKLILTK